MNDDERDTPPEGLPPLPVASPRHPTPPRRSTTKEIALDAILQKAKKQQARKPLNYTLISVVVAALASGVVTGLKKSSDASTDTRSSSEQLRDLKREVRKLRRDHEALKRAVPMPVDETPEEKDDPP